MIFRSVMLEMTVCTPYREFMRSITGSKYDIIGFQYSVMKPVSSKNILSKQRGNLWSKSTILFDIYSGKRITSKDDLFENKAIKTTRTTAIYSNENHDENIRSLIFNLLSLEDDYLYPDILNKCKILPGYLIIKDALIRSDLKLNKNCTYFTYPNHVENDSLDDNELLDIMMDRMKEHIMNPVTRDRMIQLHTGINSIDNVIIDNPLEEFYEYETSKGTRIKIPLYGANMTVLSKDELMGIIHFFQNIGIDSIKYTGIVTEATKEMSTR